jgi:iron complex transport system substrate-binding protein
VSASRIDSESLDGAEIDRSVREAVAGGEPLYALDADLIERLEPDVIVTQDLCTVCAVSSDHVGRLTSVGADVVSLDPRTITEIEQSVLALAERLGVSDRGRAVVSRMEETLDRVRARVDGHPRRRVFVAEWLDPPYASGHWLPEMVDVAGGREVLGRAGEPARPTTWEEVAAAKPDLIVLAPCGFDSARAAREAEGLTLPAPAVPVDANAYFSRPAPRIVEGIEQLAALFHPELRLARSA